MYDHILSRIHILQDKIHKVIKDIRNINKQDRIRKTKNQNYKANPNTSHNSERNRLSGENHHPELDSLSFGEGPEDSSPAPSTSDGCSTSDRCSTSTDNTSDCSSSTSVTSKRYAQSDPPPEMTTDCPVDEERGEIEDELVSPDCPSDTSEDLHPNSTDLHPNRNGRKAVAAARRAVSDGPT